MTRTSYPSRAAGSDPREGIDGRSAGRSPASRGRTTRSRGGQRTTLTVVDPASDERGQGAPPEETAGCEEPEQAARERALLRELEETGATWCPLRTSSIARDRCVELQHRTRCGRACWKGPLVRLSRAQDLVAQQVDEERSARARALQGTNPPPREPWRNVCRYRACGRVFEEVRRWNSPRRYCCTQHRDLEAEARAIDRELGRRVPV